MGQTDLEIKYKKGVEYLKAKKFSESKKIFDEILSTKPENIRLLKYSYIWRSKSNQGLENLTAAIHDITEAIKLDSTDLASFMDRGNMLKDANQTEKALTDYNYVISKDSTSDLAEAAFYYKAYILYYKGKYKESQEYCTRAINLDPELYDVLFLRSNAHSMLFKFELAIKDLDKIIAKYPNYKEAYTNRATSRVNLHKGIKDRMSKTVIAKICADLDKALELGDKKAEDLHYVFCTDRKK